MEKAEAKGNGEDNERGADGRRRQNRITVLLFHFNA
jgi:hypothetical protein